jgi:hypothetical protein
MGTATAFRRGLGVAGMSVAMGFGAPQNRRNVVRR